MKFALFGIFHTASKAAPAKHEEREWSLRCTRIPKLAAYAKGDAHGLAFAFLFCDG